MTSKAAATCATLFFVTALGLSPAALSHGGGGGGAGGGNAGGGGHSSAAGSNSGTASGGNGSDAIGRDKTPVCPQGFVAKAGNCLHARAGAVPDQELYAQGRALALAGYYSHALPVLEAITRTDDSMVFTMRGYALRKLGNYPASMALYAKALAIDPDNVNTHEYLGEAYVALGKLEPARAELATVLRLCRGPECEQYADLSEAIKTGMVE